MSAVPAQVRDVIVEILGVSSSKVVPDARFEQDLGADSLDIVELVMALEEEFEVDFPDERIEQMTTVQAVVDQFMPPTA